MKNDYAIKLTSNFILSYLKFIVDTDEIYKNPKIKKFYKKSEHTIPYKANLFDMDLCGVMFRDPAGNFIKYTDFFAVTIPRKYNLKKYKCRKKLKKVTESYLDDKYSVWTDSVDIINEFVDLKDREFDEMLNIENMIGMRRSYARTLLIV